jgi:serine/threonine protein kinase/tetratricopeptide (TPR) repeat protein
MLGQTILHYKILEKLGEGGMGVVYKAQDTKLDRFVALKFLPAHVAKSEQEKTRFFQEAKSASALNHPNVCTIYGIDEADEMQFIEMESVDGATLRDKVTASSPLPVKQVVDYAIQIAEALQEAHSKGIIHRDIKAENIMVNSKDQIKVMDFGLAKLKGSLKLTRTSSTIGTLAYMSPEQIQGIEADTRSDIFSYGVVLFEMTTGKMPFRGEHEAAVMYSIVNEEPENAAKFRSDIPDELLHILKKSLEKDPEDRYQSMSEIIVDLRRLKKESTRVVRIKEYQTGAEIKKQTAAVTKQHMMVSRQSIMLGTAVIVLLLGGLFFKESLRSLFTRDEKKVIVVLPFENLGPDDKNYFVDGMTDEVTSRLSGLSGLKVIARSSAVQYKNTTKSLKQIGEELGVNFILQGTVRWETVDGKTNVRVNPTLIRVEDETQAWSESIESVLSSAFKLQSDIASRVAGAMNVALAGTEKQSLETSLTENSEAYDLYLQAAEYSSRSMSRQDNDIAIRLLEQAVRIDPSFAAAYARLAKVHGSYYWFFYDRTEKRIAMALDAAKKAVQLAPDLSEAREAMGWYYYHTQLDYVNALKEFDLALKYSPSNANVHYGIAAVKRRQGDMQGSIASFKNSIEANPRATDIIRQLGETQTLQRDYAAADVSLERSIAMTPDVVTIYWDRIKNELLWKGDIASAKRMFSDAKLLGKNVDMKYLVEFIEYSLELYDRKYDAAWRVLDKMPEEEINNSQFTFSTVTLLKGELLKAKGRSAEAQKYYAQAVADLQQRIIAAPNDERYHSALGIALAGVGRSEEAVRSGLKAIELLPYEKEAWRGSFRMMEMAQIYGMVGEEEKAMDLIEKLLSLPCELSRHSLRHDPAWMPLKNNKRFQKLVQ